MLGSVSTVVATVAQVVAPESHLPGGEREGLSVQCENVTLGKQTFAKIRYIGNCTDKNRGEKVGGFSFLILIILIYQLYDIIIIYFFV